MSGQIKSITDFGIFIGLDGGIDGLVHLSDISWNTTGEDVVRNYKKGDTLEAVVLAVDPERERISLGVKQLEQDPMGQYVATNAKGSIVKGIVKEVDAKGATDRARRRHRGLHRRPRHRQGARRGCLAVPEGRPGSRSQDHRHRPQGPQHAAVDQGQGRGRAAEALADYNRRTSDASSGTTKLGALLREQLGNKSE